jgi:hypothetical protein
VPRTLQAALVIAAVLAALPLAALAHAMDRLWAQDVPAGPYLITLSSQAGIAPGAARLTVWVRLADTGAEVEDAAVQVWLTPPGQEERRGPFPAAPGEPSPPVHYDAIVQADAVGRWTATVEVQGAAGQGAMTAEVEVSESGTTFFVILAIAGGLLILGLLGLAYRRVSEETPVPEKTA